MITASTMTFGPGTGPTVPPRHRKSEMRFLTPSKAHDKGYADAHNGESRQEPYSTWDFIWSNWDDCGLMNNANNAYNEGWDEGLEDAK